MMIATCSNVFCGIIFMLVLASACTKEPSKSAFSSQDYKKMIEDNATFVIHGADLEGAIDKWRELWRLCDTSSEKIELWMDFQFQIVTNTTKSRLKADLRRLAIQELGFRSRAGFLGDKVQWFEQNHDGWEFSDSFEKDLVQRVIANSRMMKVTPDRGGNR